MAVSLNEQEKAYVKSLIDRGEPLPTKYRGILFDDVPEVELVWPGKTRDVTNVVLPFQSIEQIDEPRAEKPDPQLGFLWDTTSGRQTEGWTNKLIWGDNKLVLSSLKNGPLRHQIEKQGGLKLVYIDPPFDVGADFSIQINVGDERVLKEPSIIEEVAYRDTWGRGSESYLAMIYERLQVIRDLLSDDGSIYLHCDWRVSPLLRMTMDEIFGKENFQNEVYWYYYNKLHGATKNVFPRATDTLLFYVKNRQRGYTFHHLTEPREKPVKKLKYHFVDGKILNDKDEHGRTITYLSTERQIDNVWRIRCLQPADQHEWLSYPTQKPQDLIERIISASSNEGDLVADFFCGSGTTLAAAEGSNRKWIGVDLSRFAIHTSRKRLIGVQRELKSQGKPYRSFEILNLGKYERQYWVGINLNLPDEECQRQTLQREEHYLTLILEAYKAERLFQLPPFHGRKGPALVVVGPVDAPVTRQQVMEIVAACRQHRASRVDVLGFEFEMGLVPYVRDEVQAQGVNMSLKYIPKDVFDRRAVERGQVTFYDVAYVEVDTQATGLSVTVMLKDFGVYYQQDDLNVLADQMKNGASKVTVEVGQVVKVSKDKHGRVTREVLTKKWSDWIDYWAVDFDFERRQEIIRIEDGNGTEREVWTGNYIFENEWQAFRTRKDRTLELASAPHTYSRPGRYKIAVKVIDIFGIDTTKVVEVVMS